MAGINSIFSLNDNDKLLKNHKDIAKLKAEENAYKRQSKDLLSYFEALDYDIPGKNKNSLKMIDQIVSNNINTTKNKISKDNKIRAHFNSYNKLDSNNNNQNFQINNQVQSAKNSIYKNDSNHKLFQPEYLNAQPNLMYNDILKDSNKKALSKFASKKSDKINSNKLVKIEKDSIENVKKENDFSHNKDKEKDILYEKKPKENSNNKLSKFNSSKNNKKLKNNENSFFRQDDNIKNIMRSSSIFHFDHSINNFKTQYNKIEKEDNKSIKSIKLNIIQFDTKIPDNKNVTNRTNKKDLKKESKSKLILNDNLENNEDLNEKIQSKDLIDINYDNIEYENLVQTKQISNVKEKDTIKKHDLKLNLNFINNANYQQSSNEAHIDSKSAKPFIKRFNRDEREKEVFNTDCFADIYSIKFENSFGTITDNIKLIPLESNRLSQNKQTTNTKANEVSENLKQKDNEEKKKPKKFGCFSFCF